MVLLADEEAQYQVSRDCSHKSKGFGVRKSSSAAIAVLKKTEKVDSPFSNDKHKPSLLG